MKSANAITYELDDAYEAAQQLSRIIKQRLKLLTHSIGILFCDADMDGAAVTSRLKEMLGIEIAGMSTLAPLSHEGYHQSAAVLTVMTADDCTFTATASRPLTKDNLECALVSAYNQTIPANAPADYKPDLLYTFCPNGISFSADKYPEILSKITQNAPIIGGVASDDYEYVSARVFLSGSEFKDSIIIVNISGNVKPRFSIRHVTSRFAERIRKVTSATDNIVHTVGDESFAQYLEGFGLKTDVPDVLLAFNPYPMMLTQDDDGDVPLMRHITGLDLVSGSGSCVGDVPVGAKANICLINKNDLVTSCRESLNALIKQTDPAQATSPSPDPTSSTIPTSSLDPTSSSDPASSLDPATSPTPTTSTDPATSPTPASSTDPATSPTPTSSTDPATSLDPAKEGGEYEYSTVLCISCCGRALLLGADSDAEGKVISELIPKNWTLSGAYCFGEICPTRYRNRQATNRFHNCSITFCLI